MKRLILPLAALAATPLWADVTLTDADLTDAYSAQSISGRVTCHDPSVFMDTINYPKTSPRYYIYGSHLGRGYTSADLNYQSWTVFKTGEESTGSANSLFANTSGTLVNYKNAYSTHAVTKVKDVNGQEVTFGNFDAHGWQYDGSTVAGNQWAPDIIYNPTMQKWCMYMSLNGDHWCSVICCFTSDSPEGPWVYQGPVVFSGFMGSYKHVSYDAADDYKHTDLEIALGELSSLPARYKQGSSWGSYWPNCIDPCVFYDEKGQLWMSYGSWSGGIFMLQLDETNGLRDYTVKYPQTFSSGSDYRNCTSDPYFGTKIAGGWYVSGEASYIEKIGDYYFLFMSYGGLVAAGGYQMRVFRSENPDGPYVDCCTDSGISAIYNTYRLNYSSDANRDEGMKIFGNYQWDAMSVAELAQGHNSAIVDHEGRAMVVYHTRFNDGTEGHSVRVHQLFLNEDGWVVAAPYEFSGETANQATIAGAEHYTADEICGTYQLLIHKYRQNTANKEYAAPENITLQADGTVTGAYEGTWSRTAGTDYITLTLSGILGSTSEVTFKGVLTAQTVDYTDISALCFTALSSSSGAATSGGAAVQTHGLSIWGSKVGAKQAIKYTLDKITIAQTVTTDLTLPAGKMGATLTWSSSDPSILSNEGKIVSKGNVTLTATISKDGYVYTRDYAVNTDGDATPVYYPETGATDFSTGFMGAWSDEYTLARGKKASFKFYNYTNEAENWKNWILFGYSTTGKELFAIRADRYDVTAASSDSFTECDFVWDTFKQDMNGALVEMDCEFTTSRKFNMSATITTTSGKVYHMSYSKSFTSYTSLVLKFTVENAYITKTGPNGEDASSAIEQVYATPTYDGRTYNLTGQPVSDSYNGIIIRGGKKLIMR